MGQFGREDFCEAEVAASGLGVVKNVLSKHSRIPSASASNMQFWAAFAISSETSARLAMTADTKKICISISLCYKCKGVS